MKKFLVQVIGLTLLIGVGLVFFNPSVSAPNIPFLPQKSKSSELTIGDKKLTVEIADTKEMRSKGLGGRDSLASESGMLFIFPKADKYPFWMKGLQFPLDFVYIRGGEIVELLPNIPAPAPGQKDESLAIYLPKEDVDKVLEVSSGTIEKLNLKVGDKIQLN